MSPNIHSARNVERVFRTWAAVLDGQLATSLCPNPQEYGAAQNDVDAQRRRCDVPRNKTRTDWDHGGPDPQNVIRPDAKRTSVRRRTVQGRGVTATKPRRDTEGETQTDTNWTLK